MPGSGFTAVERSRWAGQRTQRPGEENIASDATTAVLLPGNMCDARLWSGGGGVIETALTARGFAVAYADLSGAATIAGMAAGVLARVGGRLLPVGFSMGGIVALEMAAAGPGAHRRRWCWRTPTPVPTCRSAPRCKPGAAGPRPRRSELATIVADELKPNYLAAANRDDTALKALLFDMAMGQGDGRVLRAERGAAGPAQRQ